MKYCFLLMLCVNPLKLFSQQPLISSFSPASGKVDSTVIITGLNFDKNPLNNIVYFGAVKAIVTNASGSSISATVPAGATYAPITITNKNYTAYSSQPFMPVFSGGKLLKPSSFVSQPGLSTGQYPRSITSGDFNLDGKPDLIAVNNNSNTFSVFQNTTSPGQISFKKKTDYETGSTPFCVVTGDMNSDGLLDVIVSNYNENTVSVYKNKSTAETIIFNVHPASFSTADNPNGLAIADIDGDAKPDIIAVNNNGYSVSVLRNISTKTTMLFEAKKDFSTGTWPLSIATGDFNGDGLQDLAVTNHDDNTISIFKNTSTKGNISFALKQDYETGTYPFGITTGDINGDGKPEIIVTNSSDGTISIFKNRSTKRTILFNNKKDFPAGNSPLNVKISDLNGDARPDLAIVNFSQDVITAFQNNSNGDNISFNKKINYPAEQLPREVVLEDLDGDSKPDMAVVNSGSNSISLLKNQMSQASSVIAGVAEIKNSETYPDKITVTISPNPATSYFELHINTVKSLQPITIQVMNASGNILVSGTKSIANGINSIKYNVSSWPAGLYVVKIISANGTQQEIKLFKR